MSIAKNISINNENDFDFFEDWRLKEFSSPEKKIRLATVFSGIGAIEHALKRLKLKHEVIFAGDIDKYVKQSYFANYDIDEKNWHDDINFLSCCMTPSA